MHGEKSAISPLAPCETTNRTFYTRIKYEPACIYLMYNSYKDNIAKNKTASAFETAFLSILFLFLVLVFLLLFLALLELLDVIIFGSFCFG